MKSAAILAFISLWIGLASGVRAQSITTYAVGNRPSGIAFDRTYIHVANDDDGTVSRISPKTGKVTLTYSANGHGSNIFFDGTYIWTANYRDSTVSKLTTGGVLKGTYAVGSGPMRLAFDGTNIWATLPDAGSVVKISRSTGAILGNYAAGPVPWGIFSDGTYIWVVNNPGYLTKLSKTGALLASYDSGGTLAGSNATDGTFFYLTHYQTGNISKIRKATGAIEASFQAEPGIGDVFYEGHQLWVAGSSSGSVLRINTADMTLIERVQFPEGAVPAAISFDGVRVWSTNLNTASVSAF